MKMYKLALTTGKATCKRHGRVCPNIEFTPMLVKPIQV